MLRVDNCWTAFKTCVESCSKASSTGFWQLMIQHQHKEKYGGKGLALKIQCMERQTDNLLIDQTKLVDTIWRKI